MVKRIIALLTVVILAFGTLAGCAGGTPTKTPGGKSENKAQLVVALNPILVYDDSTVVIAYNDIRGAVRQDREAASLTALHGESNWTWAYKEDDKWRQRGIYGLDSWTNGAGKEAKKTAAYAFSVDNTVSLSTFAGGSPALTGYGSDTLPEVGILLSATGKEEEALYYTVEKDGVMQMPAGTISAVSEVAGVKTGFLAEDGTSRRASVRIMRNNVQLWSGTLMNSTAAPDGVAVTSLSYPQLNDIAVSAGDKLFIAVQLEASANRDEDVSDPQPNDADNWSVIRHESQVEVEKKPTTQDTVSDGSVPFITDYASTFRWVISNSASAEISALSELYRDKLVNKLQAPVIGLKDTLDATTNEIVIGLCSNRPESVKIYEELLTTRTNNAADYIIRLVGGSLYIVAGNEQSMEQALEYFNTKIAVDDRSIIPVGYNYYFAPELKSITLGGADIGAYTIRTERFPSYIVQMAAEDLQAYVRLHTGYILEIRPETKAGGNSAAREIRVGPIQNEVKATRMYDTHFDMYTMNQGVTHLSIEDDGLLDMPETRFQIWMDGVHLCVNGGSTYAINAGVQTLMKEIEKKTGKIPAGYSVTGEYDKGYSLSRGYAVTLADEFSYQGDDTEEDIRNLWNFANDTSTGPTVLKKDSEGKPILLDQQRRPDIFGDNWWIWNNSDSNHGGSYANGYLLQVTKKESYGYSSTRIMSYNAMAFRYGIWETRLVMSTRNGACSALWSENRAPDRPDNEAIYPEIDVYENFGRDSYYSNLHTWRDRELEPSTGHIDHREAGDEDCIIGLMEPKRDEHFYDTFHHMGFVWTSEGIDFFMDGEIHASVQFDSRKWNAFRTSITLYIVNGVGSYGYAIGNNNPQDYMGYGAGDTDNFFELQIVDYTRIYQTNFANVPKLQQSQLIFARDSGWYGTEYAKFANK